jgi:Cd2+/Zn2+-exporting ATPase
MSATDRSLESEGGTATAAAPSADRTVRLRVPDMDCPSCLLKIQGRLESVDGVLAVEGSPVARSLRVTLDPTRVDVGRVRDEIDRLGYRTLADDAGLERSTRGAWTGRTARIAYASMALFALGLLLRALGVDGLVATLPYHDLRVPDLVLLASAAVGGWNFFPRGLAAVRARSLDMNFLMTVAILGAAAIGETTEAAAIAFLFALAELLEGYSVDRARASVEALMELAPATARVLRGGREHTVAVAELMPGDVIALRPGERVPVDGVVEEGRSAVDQSAVTGESLPVDKGPGAELFAGTINREGFLRFRATRPAADSALARIVRLVEEAEAGKGRTERFVERFARVYTPLVTAAAVLVVVVPVAALGLPFALWFERGLTLLVIACPCALVISTPVAVVSGVTAAARHGVLIKGGRHLEAAGEVRVLALDKTGTLTFGHLAVTDVIARNGRGPDDVLARAAAVESRSEHPVARAVLEAARARGLGSAGVVTDFEALPGRGARASLDGVPHLIGRPELVDPDGRDRAPARLSARGAIVVGVAADGEPLGWIALEDRPRDTAVEALGELRRLGIRPIVMLTGDRPEVARAVGEALGVDEIRSGLLPEDKVAAVRELEARYGPLAMVGDGINDAPALAAARLGIAMGAAGSDTALETADVALMGDDLRRVPYLVRLSRRARRVIRQNIGFALGVKALLVLGVPLGMVSLIAAVVIGDMGVSLAVTLNALRLGRVGDRG